MFLFKEERQATERNIVMSSIDDYARSVQAPLFDKIPLKLRAGRHHVVWKLEERRGELLGKTPYIARAILDNGKLYRASSTKPKSWSSFPQAMKAYQRGNFDGIGYVLTHEQGIIFIDIDHCIDPDTGAPNAVACEILDLLNSNAERSPTTGVHAFITGTLPPDTQSVYLYKGTRIEMYDSGRYSTITGQPVPGYAFQEVQPRQGQLLTLIERLSMWQRENTSCVVLCDADPVANVIVLDQHRPPATGHQSAPTPEPPCQVPTPAICEEDLSPLDQAVLMKARSAKNGHVFRELWDGGNPHRRITRDGRPDSSAADFDLVLMLLYWTGDNETNDTSNQVERLFRASGRYDEKTDRITAHKRYTYLQMTIYNARQKRYKATWRTPPTSPAKPTPEQEPPEPPITPQPSGTKRAPARRDRRITHAHRWTRASETPEQRQQKLEECARQVAQAVEQHIRTGGQGLLVANVAPGVGKSTTVAPLGERSTSGDTGNSLNLAWIAERRDMVASVPALRYYRQIEPCTRHNCDDHQLHNALGERGYNAWSVHKKHKLQCDYAQQFTQDGSAIYQLAHVATRYPASHQGIVIDELDITKWLPEREISIAKLTTALRKYATGSTADVFLRTIEATITDAMQAREQLHSLDLFDALDRRCNGQLQNHLGELAQDPRNINTHPWIDLEENDPAAAALEATELAPVVLPHIVVALINEISKWQRGQPWNSRLRIGPGSNGWSLYISERLAFTPGEQGIPARALLDATADSELLERIFRTATGKSEPIQTIISQVEPPPGTRHIAVRTGKRYGKVSLTAKRHNGKANESLRRAIAETRYLLRDLDPDDQARDAQRIGLISYKGCVDAIGEALNIPEERRLHFWAARGSNALEDCAILLVIGTPTIAPDVVARLARALWADDPQPIDPTPRRDTAGHIAGYVDPRMDRLNAYLSHAELTQCAHRSRALRHQGRIIVTMCQGEIGYLPATETITELPQLTADGRDRWSVAREAEQQKLAKARTDLEQQGKTLDMLTVRELRAVAGVSTDAASEYLRMVREAHISHTQSSHTHTHTCVLTVVPENPIELSDSKVRYKPPETVAPPHYEEPCIRCGRVDDWVQEPDDGSWVCSCYYWWYEHPDWRGDHAHHAGDVAMLGNTAGPHTSAG